MADGTDKDNGDYLGYGVYAETLWARVISALDRDHQGEQNLGDDPLVVGIFGEWGAGKSTLLKLIERHAVERAKERAAWRTHDGGNFSLTVPVFFQPWKYEHEPHLHVPILLHILAALKQHMEQAQTPVEWAQGKIPEAIKQHMDLVVGTFGLLLAGAAFAMDTTVPLSSRVALAGAGLLAKVLPKLNPDADKEELAKTLEFKENGRFFYEMHETLQAITRPRRYAKHLTGVSLSTEVSINFVIFIDDLDRCLPEKAVETLELIKTVFNLESFAFVLALDEEVVERGIGHRYKDYALQNKKPEMPITGFEYLEKIVHLPFRLPLLTAQQGLQFLARHESALLEEQAHRRWPGKVDAQQTKERSLWLVQRRWFSADGGRDSGLINARVRDASGSAKEPFPIPAEPGSAETSVQHRLHLAHLVLGSFNAHVPRKLIRVVELFNQVQDVLEAMKPPRQLTLGGEFDPRSVLALLLLQLFQPDLYRSLRRSADTFELFFDAFKPIVPSELTGQGRSRRQLSASTADADLLHWAVYFIDEQPPGTLRAAQQRIPRLDVAERHATQHKRLPLVERLLEHRCIQRHPFDPLKLMQLLEQSNRANKIPLRFDGNLFALLARDATDLLQMPTELVETVVASAQTGGHKDIAEGVAKLRLVAAGEGSSLGVELTTTPALVRPNTRTVEPPDINALFLALVAPDEATQKTVAQVAGLVAGDALGPRSAQALIAQVERDFLRTEIGQGGGQDLVGRRLRLAQGLTYLAPHLDLDNARALWRLTQLPAPKWESGKPHSDTTHLKDSALRADLYAALGLDDRFDPGFFHLPRNRFSDHDVQREPLQGFVWVQKRRANFHSKQGDRIQLAPFLMARYLTTVDQFAAFVEGEGYKKADLWDSQGWAWITGEWDRHPTTPEWLRKRLGRRPVDERQNPAQWAQQRPWGSRPVCGVNWFEARAYVNWLNGQGRFRDRLKSSGLGAARVELPIEAQWERAARATDFNDSYDKREYVWVDDSAHVELRANIRQSGLGQASPVGLFPASPLGICDLNGNLWEWQDSLYESRGSNLKGMRVPPLTSLPGTMGEQMDWVAMTEKYEDFVGLALRGGSWDNTAVSARASIRQGDRPDHWGNNVGFRVVLSLAE